jgi:endoglucanase
MKPSFKLLVRISFLILLSTLLLAATRGAAQPKATDVFDQSRKLGRGVNIIGYDPIWRAPDQGRFKAKHFKLLKQAGFDSVRINLFPYRCMNPSGEWGISNSWFQVMDWAVAQAQKQGLMVILDLHEFEAMGQNPEAGKEKFLSAWRQISAHCRKAPASVLFEVLNEPSGKLTPALWNQYLSEGLAIIRKTNPDRTVIIGPAFWNSIDHLKELNLPSEDHNIIVTVHYYSPMDFTHQGAPWAGRADKLGVVWLGTEKDLGAISNDFDRAASWGKAHNRPIFLGEFGAYDKAPMDSRVRYIGSVARAAEQRGWSWAYWQFDNDFILYDIDKDAWVEPIRKALAPVQPQS